MNKLTAQERIEATDKELRKRWTKSIPLGTSAVTIEPIAKYLEIPAGYQRVDGNFNFGALFGTRIKNDGWVTNFFNHVLTPEREKLDTKGSAAVFRHYMIESVKGIAPEKRSAFLRAVINNRFSDESFSYYSKVSEQRQSTTIHKRLVGLFRRCGHTENQRENFDFKHLRRGNYLLVLKTSEADVFYASFLLEHISEELLSHPQGEPVKILIQNINLFQPLTETLRLGGMEAGIFLEHENHPSETLR